MDHLRPWVAWPQNSAPEPVLLGTDTETPGQPRAAQARNQTPILASFCVYHQTHPDSLAPPDTISSVAPRPASGSTTSATPHCLQQAVVQPWPPPPPPPSTTPLCPFTSLPKTPLLPFSLSYPSCPPPTPSPSSLPLQPPPILNESSSSSSPDTRGVLVPG